MEKKLYKNLAGKTYTLTTKTAIDESLCQFERAHLGQLSILGGYAFAYRGNCYDENQKVVDYLTSATPHWFHQHVMGLKYDGFQLVENPLNRPYWNNQELALELFSRWHKGAVIWLEITSPSAKYTLAEYIGRCKNPAIFASPIGGIIVISDEPDRPGDIILRVWEGHFNG